MNTAFILFLLGTLAFVTAMLRAPPESLACPVVLPRSVVPEVALDLRLAVLALVIAWLAIWLFGRSSASSAWTLTSTRPAHRVAA